MMPPDRTRVHVREGQQQTQMQKGKEKSHDKQVQDDH
jgi:hypothetical protein